MTYVGGFCFLQKVDGRFCGRQVFQKSLGGKGLSTPNSVGGTGALACTRLFLSTPWPHRIS